LQNQGRISLGPRPNGAAIVKRKAIGIVACIGDAHQGPVLQTIDLKEVTQTFDDPGGSTA
jgi:hypothetical protein